MNTSELIYDWNKNHPPGLKPPGPVLLNDESLRDGLQSPSVRDPSIPEKIEILHLMEALGINALDLGLPGAGPRAVEAVTALAREIVAHKMKIQPNCAARTHENDIRPIAEIVQKTGLRIEAATFIGSSPIRRFTEGWTDDFLVQTARARVEYLHALTRAMGIGVYGNGEYQTGPLACSLGGLGMRWLDAWGTHTSLNISGALYQISTDLWTVFIECGSPAAL